jgi:arginine exporter protein ArgO
MSERSVFFLIIMGILLTMLGVGGVENSITNMELLQSIAVSGLGLLLMWVATLAIKTSKNG